MNIGTEVEIIGNCSFNGWTGRVSSTRVLSGKLLVTIRIDDKFSCYTRQINMWSKDVRIIKPVKLKTFNAWEIK